MRKIGERSRDILLRDDLVISPLTRPYELVVDHAEGSTVYDIDGNSYLDFASGVAVMNIGYNCRKVKEAVCAQMEKMVHCGFSDFCAEMPVRLAEKLSKMTGYKKVFLSNSGARGGRGGHEARFLAQQEEGNDRLLSGLSWPDTGCSLAYKLQSAAQRIFPVLAGYSLSLCLLLSLPSSP